VKEVYYAKKIGRVGSVKDLVTVRGGGKGKKGELEKRKLGGISVGKRMASRRGWERGGKE